MREEHPESGKRVIKPGRTGAVFAAHKGGKIATTSLVELKSIEQLRVIYTPGVAEVSRHIAGHPDAVKEYTCIGNTVCIATNGSAVLGLGNVGVLAAMPVMEGKSVIVKNMAGVNCVPLLIESDNPSRIVEVLTAVSPTFSAIMIEDIKAPLCFEVEKQLQEKVPIPVFHDDQHGTAVVILAALINAVKKRGLNRKKVSIVINGAGAAGLASADLLLRYGFPDIIVCDREGAVYRGRKKNMNPYKKVMSGVTNLNGEKGPLSKVIAGKDIFIGVSSPGVVSADMIRAMNPGPIVLGLANPVPEIWPEEAIAAGASVSLDGRTINNCLAFPGIIRGALKSGARRITYKMKIEAACTIASLAGKNEIVPDFMNKKFHDKVAAAVAGKA